MEKEKVVSIEDRIPKLKQSRKKKANRRLLFYLSVFFLLIAMIVYLQSPLSHIKHLTATGNQTLSNEDLVKQSGLSTGDNIWMINKKRTAKKLAAHPMVKEASVTRILPRTVELKVEEYKTVGYIEEKDEFYPLLENGKLLTSEPMANKGSGPLLHDFKNDDYLERLSEELEMVPDDIFHLISEIVWDPTEKNKYRIMLYMNDGFVVQTTIRNFASKMETYPSIVSQLDEDEKGIVHMGVGTYFEEFTD